MYKPRPLFLRRTAFLSINPIWFYQINVIIIKWHLSVIKCTNHSNGQQKQRNLQVYCSEQSWHDYEVTERGNFKLRTQWGRQTLPGNKSVWFYLTNIPVISIGHCQILKKILFQIQCWKKKCHWKLRTNVSKMKFRHKHSQKRHLFSETAFKKRLKFPTILISYLLPY